MKRVPGNLKLIVLGGALACLIAVPVNLGAHEIVGQVTPLMIHMKRALILIENGKEQEAVHEIHMVFEDFSHDMGMGMVMEGVGLKKTASEIDSRLGTRLGPALGRAIENKDAQRLKKLIQALAYLLMLEKFEALHSSLSGNSKNHDVQKTMFWLGRNYFSYLLEPELAIRDPIEEKRLDRLLDSMLYRVEDRLPDEFLSIQNDLKKGVTQAFALDLSALMVTGSHSEPDLE